MNTSIPVVNPYAKAASAAVTPHNNEEEMGRQSQQRVSNEKRKYQLAAANTGFTKRAKGQQQTLVGTLAFNSEKDCIVCAAVARKRYQETVRVPKRPHHELCIKNSKTKGRGKLTVQAMNNLEDDKRYKHITRPIQADERGSWKHSTKEAGTTFFAQRTRKQSPETITTTTTTTTTTITTTTTATKRKGVAPLSLSEAVTKMLSDASFCERHKTKNAPIAMIAFAEVVSEKVIRKQSEVTAHFRELTITVPATDEVMSPHYHSIVGQKLLLVDWERMYGLSVACPHASCEGRLRNDRTNFSKNKTLFPIFGLDGAPAWCMVQSMKCRCCASRFDANDGAVLFNVPDYAAEAYPVEARFAFSNTSCHLSRITTEAFESIMLTYGNGELCSKLLYNVVNRNYISRLKAYYSYIKIDQPVPPPKEGSIEAPDNYISKDAEYIKTFPPSGDSIRDMFDSAFLSDNNKWGVSDHDTNTCEIQAVRCSSIFTQDHTFEATKNYQFKRLGAKAAWDVGTETGEIAAVVLVPSTKTQDFSHAAQQLMKRPGFRPKAMYSDTWPNKNTFWEHICPGIEGRLGLFHFEKQIISTLRKKHVDCMDAITDLLSALYAYYPADFEQLLLALKNGSLSPTGKQYSSSEITELRGTKVFRDRYARFLRKRINEKQTIIQALDDWFCRYKVTSLDPMSQPPGGRLDPVKGVPLFTPDTRTAVENCKLKAEYLADPLPLEEMYDKIPPNPNSKHGLTEYLSKRGESKLEAFHDRFAHFANCGMRDSLADNLNLAGTAR